MGVWRDVLQWVLTTWQNFEVFEGITIWNIIVVSFISFGVISVILVNFGGTGIAKGVTDIRTSYQNDKQYKNMQKQNTYNNSYEAYKERQDRISSYQQRYRSEKGK